MKNQKIAFVTGGTGGIGTAICIGLAQQGRRVVAGYYPPEQEAAEAWQTARKQDGYDIEIAAGDVSDFEASCCWILSSRKRGRRPCCCNPMQIAGPIPPVPPGTNANF